VNEQMPYYVVTRLMSALNMHRKSLGGAKVLMLGVAYKADIDDMRESPAIKIAELLDANGADISYHDPYVPMFKADGVDLRSSELTAELLADCDIAVVVTNHSNVAYDLVVQHAPLVLDTRNALKSFDSNKVVRL
jgi:UDP-N-acetyl-D-glucosamine dehydrogenase